MPWMMPDSILLYPVRDNAVAQSVLQDCGLCRAISALHLDLTVSRTSVHCRFKSHRNRLPVSKSLPVAIKATGYPQFGSSRIRPIYIPCYYRFGQNVSPTVLPHYPHTQYFNTNFKPQHIRIYIYCLNTFCLNRPILGDTRYFLYHSFKLNY